MHNDSRVKFIYISELLNICNTVIIKCTETYLKSLYTNNKNVMQSIKGETTFNGV